MWGTCDTSGATHPAKVEMSERMSLNEVLDKHVTAGTINATYPYSDPKVMTAAKARSMAGTPGTLLNQGVNRIGCTHEVLSSLEYLHKRGGNNVVTMTQNLIDPRHPDKGGCLRRSGCWHPRLGVLVGNRLPRVPGLSNPLAWNVLFNSMDKCSYICSCLTTMDLKTYFVEAAVNGTNAIRLDVLDFVALQRSTFWNYDLSHDEAMEGELTYPPLIIEKKTLATEANRLEMPEFQMIPQVACIDGNPPVHWVPLIIASDGAHVYAVIIDPTWGQFNPEGVIEGAKLMKRLIPGYSALHSGAPKAFRVGEHTAEKRPREQVLQWFAQSPDQSLRGASVGKLGDYRVV